MTNDSIVDEVRKNGLDFVARYNNDVTAVYNALKEKERLSTRRVIDRTPQRILSNRKSNASVNTNLRSGAST